MRTPDHLRAKLDTSLVVDSKIPLTQLDHFGRSATSPRHATMLAVIREHFYREMDGADIEKLMVTMVAQPEHVSYGLGVTPNIGYDQVRHHYERSLGSRAAGGCSIDIEHLVVDDGTACLAGLALFSAEFVRDTFDLAIDATGAYVVAKRVAVVVPFDGDRISGEYHYYAGPFGPDDVVALSEPGS